MLPSNPQIYATLMQRSCEGLEKSIEDDLILAFSAAAISCAHRMASQFRDIYAAGLRDGFQQGVAAECARKEKTGAE